MRQFVSVRGGVDWRKSAGFRGYEFVYFVNDSVFGPFAPLEPLLEKMESSAADLFGMASAQRYIQSSYYG
ncbi:MAG: rhamnan synthesis F family protein, partial [Rickettsiales bacterium]|nr:rhamnan synthesis F family protein [Rickettsiales bacterium]